MHVRHMIAMLLVATMASGCVAIQRTPTETMVSGLRAVAIVPIEAPPLLLHPRTEADRAAVAAVGLAPPGPGGNPFPYAPYMPLTIFCPLCAAGFAIAMPVTLAASSTPRAREAATMTREQPPPWMPTAGLARIASQLLQRAGRPETFVVEGYAVLPIADRSVNEYLENWMAPVRRWYNAEVSMLDGAQLGAPQVDAILEVGVSNYEYIGSRLILQVMAKLSDPRTKQVLGRARNADSPKAESLALMLQDHGQPLRRLIETTGEALVIQCLKDLGLIPR
jgi:hypothetical protein